MLYKGEVIQCSNTACKMDIAIIAKDICYGQKLYANLFNFVTPYKDGELMVCKECRSYFYSRGKLYIKGQGWIC